MRVQRTAEPGATLPRQRTHEAPHVALGYRDLDAIDPRAFMDREDEGVLYAPKAGEVPYEVRGPKP